MLERMAVAVPVTDLRKKPVPRPELTIARFSVAETPPLVASDGQPADPTYERSSIGRAPASMPDGTPTRPPPAQLESAGRNAR